MPDQLKQALDAAVKIRAGQQRLADVPDEKVRELAADALSKPSLLVAHARASAPGRPHGVGTRKSGLRYRVR